MVGNCNEVIVFEDVVAIGRQTGKVDWLAFFEVPFRGPKTLTKKYIGEEITVRNPSKCFAFSSILCFIRSELQRGSFLLSLVEDILKL